MVRAVLAYLGSIRWRTLRFSRVCHSFGDYARTLYFLIVYLVHGRAHAPQPALAGGFDFVTVVYRDDLALLRLQARSLDLYLDPAFDGAIVIIVNDLRPKAVIEHVRRAVLPDYGRWRDRVEIVPFYRLAYRLDPTNGWILQQVLKLSYALIARRDWYVVLDSKNHFIAPIGRDLFLDPAGFGLQPFEHRSPTLPDHYRVSTGYFGVDERATRFVPATPFLIHTQAARELLAEVERRERRQFADVFTETRCLSEFLLYGAFLHAFYGGFDRLYRDTEQFAMTHWEPDTSVTDAVRCAESEKALCFGIHLRCLAALDDKQRHSLEWFWRRYGLLRTDEGLEALRSSIGF
jgi:hypothetical protein